jgi:hypothetical protein
MRRALLASALSLAAFLLGALARAEEDGDAPPAFERAPDPAAHPGPDADLFKEALDLQARGQYPAARRRLWKLLDEFPGSPFAPEAADRSGDDDGNAFLGRVPMGAHGPSARRIDVALMGDGYLFEKQDVYDKHAQAELDLLLGEVAYGAYRSYFNFWRFNLASRDTGVDEVPRVPDEEEQERAQKRRRPPRAARQFQTALDCKAAGPQGQVMANASRVFHYLGYLDVHDGLAIVFAQKGRLGMGGGGIATTGPRGVVVHEFGHAFAWLLDEYANNPGPPAGHVEAANATTAKDRPPWQHFLDARVPKVGVFEGGATFQQGVFRPAASCAMNSGGGDPYCPVCREQVLLTIYTYVSPIDDAFPGAPEIEATRDAEGRVTWPTFGCVPMAPLTHALEVAWFLGPAPAVTAPAPEEAPYDPREDELTPEERRLRRRRADAGPREPAPEAKPDGAPARPDEAPAPDDPGGLGLPDLLPRKEGQVRRARGTGRDGPPTGKPVPHRRTKQDDGSVAAVPRIPDLPPGRHLLTVVVRDPAQPKGERFPWVLKDERGLLEDRRSWVLVVPP